jgi:hypothetical protein
MRILAGKAMLDLHPPTWLHPSRGDPAKQAEAALRAVWTAHPLIVAVTLSYSAPGITVDVALPEDNALDLAALQRELSDRVREALRRIQ